MSQNNVDATAQKAQAQGESLVTEAQKLASDALAYAQSTLHLGQQKAQEAAKDAEHTQAPGNTQKTLGDLVNDGRNLAAHVLHEAQGVVASGAQQAEATANDPQKKLDKEGKPAAQSYVDQARDLAAQAIGTVENLVKAGEKKAFEAADAAGAQVDSLSQKTTGDLKNDASKAADQTAQSAQQIGQKVVNTLDESAQRAQAQTKQ